MQLSLLHVMVVNLAIVSVSVLVYLVLKLHSLILLADCLFVSHLALDLLEIVA